MLTSSFLFNPLKCSTMTMWSVLSFLLSLAWYCQGICPEGCKELTSLYEDIGCKAIFEKPSDCCPTRYDCSAVFGKPQRKCILQGKIFDLSEKVPDENTYGSCQAGCSCTDRSGGTFSCASVECAEFFGHRPPPGCYSKYELNSCCAVDTICPPFDKLAKCEVNGKTYREGEKFEPSKGGCLSCVCQKGFKGEFVEPFCKKTSCLTELHSASDIQQNCAVVYIDGNSCCPFTFLCPGDEGVKTTTKTLPVGNETCTFGKEELNVGDKFEKVEVFAGYHTIEVKCECRVPPLVTCVHKDVYDLEKAPEGIRPFLTQK